MLDGLDFPDVFGPLRPTPDGRHPLAEIAWRSLAALLLALASLGCSRASAAPPGGGDAEGYVLDDSALKGPRDLIGKKSSVNTLGAHSE